VRITVYDTPPLTVDPAAIRAWLAQPSDEFPDYSRTESLGVDDELTAPGVGGFLNTIDDVLAAQPHGLHRRADITGVELWLIPDGEVLDQGAVITVDLANGVRLASLHQDIKDFTGRDQHGIPAVLDALAHIANQVALLLDTYHAARQDPDVPPHNTAADTAGRVTVAELIERLRGFAPQLQVWTADPRSVEGSVPLDGSVALGGDPAPSQGDPASFVVLGAAR
jgi:hypothetical protein